MRIRNWRTQEDAGAAGVAVWDRVAGAWRPGGIRINNFITAAVESKAK